MIVLVIAVIAATGLYTSGIVGLLPAALLIVAYAAATPAPVREARRRNPRRWHPRVGIGLAVPLIGPLYGWIGLWRRRL